jgi:SAM-dependent methyltransferase
VGRPRSSGGAAHREQGPQDMRAGRVHCHRGSRKEPVTTREYRRLHAEWYELVSAREDHTKEVEFLAKSIKTSGEPVLELGSGTGRVLIPLLERGLDISGIDTSEEMMEWCRAICRAKGLEAKLCQQSMTDFALPSKFGTVLLTSGGLGLFVSDQDIRSTFGRVMAHLKPGGLFLYEFEPVPAEVDPSWNTGSWAGDWLAEPDDLVIAWRKRMKYDVATHVWESLFVVEKFLN